MKEEFYDLSYVNKRKEIINFKRFENNVIVLFNFAIHSPFCDNYFKKIEIINRLNSDLNLKIIAFPNSFLFKQNEENILETEKFLLDNYQISFEVTSKIEDEPLNQLLFYKLSTFKKFKGFNLIHPLSNTLSNYYLNIDPFYDKKDGIKWIYTTFIISKVGKVVRRFECVDDFSLIIKEITKELNK